MHTEITHNATACARCNKPIKRGARLVFLEYNRRTDTYHEPGTVPLADSQGAFPLGLDCARKEQAAAEIKRLRDGYAEIRHLTAIADLDEMRRKVLVLSQKFIFS